MNGIIVGTEFINLDMISHAEFTIERRKFSQTEWENVVALYLYSPGEYQGDFSIRIIGDSAKKTWAYLNSCSTIIGLES